jgi:hypothetical protein
MTTILTVFVTTALSLYFLDNQRPKLAFVILFTGLALSSYVASITIPDYSFE